MSDRTGDPPWRIPNDLRPPIVDHPTPGEDRERVGFRRMPRPPRRPPGARRGWVGIAVRLVDAGLVLAGAALVVLTVVAFRTDVISVDATSSWSSAPGRAFVRTLAQSTTGGTGATTVRGAGPPVTVHVRATAGRRLAVVAALWVRGAVAVAFLLVLRRVLRRARDGRPFHYASVRDLRLLAGLAAFGWPLAHLAAALLTSAVAAASGPVDGPHATISVPFAPLAVGVLLAALAEVWRAGLALEADAAGTV